MKLLLPSIDLHVPGGIQMISVRSLALAAALAGAAAPGLAAQRPDTLPARPAGPARPARPAPAAPVIPPAFEPFGVMPAMPDIPFALDALPSILSPALASTIDASLEVLRSNVDAPRLALLAADADAELAHVRLDLAGADLDRSLFDVDRAAAAADRALARDLARDARDDARTLGLIDFPDRIGDRIVRPARASAFGDAADERFFNAGPREPWLASDPADSLYRAAREALNRGEYRRAAQLFSEVTRRYPGSGYAADCGYWEAYARYRIGTTDELRAAQRALGAVARTAPSSHEMDVGGLQARIQGALAVRGDSRAAEGVAESARQAGASCDQEDLAVRVEALSALSQMDAAAALPIFRRVLERRDECFVQLRQRALLMLARRADSAAASLIAYAAKNDPNVGVRADAIGYLARMPGDGWIATVEDALRTSDDERVQRAAMRALVQSENPRARASLRAVLERKDASDAMRIAAIDAFSRDRATSEDAAYLRALYGKTESERVKDAILGAVARIGGKENQDWLAGIVRNTGESSQMRDAALARLVRSDIPVADLARMYDSADSRTMREQVVYALASRREPEATDKLIDVAKNGTDPYVRRLAINYLSRKNDPRTTKLLMELIEK